ncbi:MAG: 4Fe-4S binding protein [Peptococcaceae bacterium]|nr:4Fe-4S binding protein [Peptococcaceae bacterium]
MELSNLIAMTVPVEVHAERCIHHFSPRATCKSCVQVCPTHSIHLHNNTIIIENCEGCGQCIQVCPHDVFEMDFPSAFAQSTETPLVIACKKMSLSDMPFLSSGCLQQFTWLQLALLVKRFGKIVLYAEHSFCNSCDINWFPEGQIMLMKRYGLNEYADKIHIIRDEIKLKEYIENNFVAFNTRREYIKNQFENVKHVAEKYTKQSLSGYLDAFRETVTPNYALSFEKMQAKALSLNELYDHMQHPPLSETIPLQTLASTQCRFCRICESLCAWQAVTIIEKDGKAVLAYHNVLCSRCGVCIDTCPENGLHWNYGLTVNDIAHPKWQVLSKGEAKRCKCCDEMFYPTTEDQIYCPICKNKN